MENRLASCTQVHGAAPTATGHQRRQAALACGFAGLALRNVWRGELLVVFASHSHIVIF